MCSSGEPFYDKHEQLDLYLFVVSESEIRLPFVPSEIIFSVRENEAAKLAFGRPSGRAVAAMCRVC